jgi:hypothetical protein
MIMEASEILSPLTAFVITIDFNMPKWESKKGYPLPMSIKKSADMGYG